ncbi:uncharacterized protein DS421_1g18660 [Arachis hypogaea]|nr:uncharacterized protein DS421_1g18660 [Arachis hypogaea]
MILQASIRTLNSLVRCPRKCFFKGSLDMDFMLFDNMNIARHLYDSNSVQSFLDTCKLNLDLWNQCLGHPSPKIVETILKSCNIPCEINQNLILSSEFDFRYYVSIVDAFTRYTCLYLITSKAQVLTILQQSNN